MDGDITRFCKSCDICQRTVPKGKVTKIPLGQLPIIDTAFKRVGIDIIGPIYPVSDRGYRYILTLVDYATRYPEAVPLKQISTESVAEAMISIFSRLGIPEEILSDQGTQFTSDLMKEITRLLSTKRLKTTPYNPKCNGLTEKWNGVLKTMLKRLSAERPKDWDRYIDPLLFAYREVPQHSTGFSPFELLFGRVVRGPMTILKEYWTSEKANDETKTSYQYVLDLKDRIESTCELARTELRKSQVRYKSYYDKKARDRRYKIGDLALLLLPTDNNKLLLQWKGPFSIVECPSPYNYVLDINGKRKTFHANMLKLYNKRSMVDSDTVTNNTSQAASITVLENEPDDNELSDRDIPFCDYNVPNSIEYVSINDQLSSDQKCQLTQLFQSFPEIFSDNPGKTSLVEHKIDLTTDEPIRSHIYPMPYTVRNDIQNEIKSMIDLDIIEPSNSPYASPIVLVKKKDSSNRFCADYRKVNKATKFDPEPMTKSADLFLKLKNDQYITKIDMSKGYWQISVREQDRPKTAFICPDFGCYQFKRMPFGLVNSAATFTRMMRKLLSGLHGISNYIDDIVVHNNTWEDHMRSLYALFQRLKEHNLTIKAKKCMFGFDRVEYLGHMVGRNEIQVLDENLKKIQKATRPTTKKLVKSFLGLANFYRSYIPDFADLAFPLTELTKTGRPNNVIWSEKEENAFVKLKNMLCSKPIIQIPDFEKAFIIQVDASEVGIGTVLLQEHDGKLLPVSFASRKLLPRERKYAIMEKECLAVVYAVQKYYEYLYGREFILQTDHQPLVCMNHNKIANHRIMRWSLLLQGFQMRIEAIPGKENVIADYLSRMDN